MCFFDFFMYNRYKYRILSLQFIITYMLLEKFITIKRIIILPFFEFLNN